MKLHNYGYLIFDKAVKIHTREKMVSSTDYVWTLLSTFKRLKLDTSLSPYTKINCKCIKDFNVKSETLKLLQQKLRKTLVDVGIVNYFLSGTTIS
jgi:hypothetical protein